MLIILSISTAIECSDPPNSGYLLLQLSVGKECEQIRIRHISSVCDVVLALSNKKKTVL